MRQHVEVPLHGQLAQLVEHRLHTAGATGSSPVLPTMHGAVVKTVITPACHAGGRGFESLPFRHNKISISLFETVPVRKDLFFYFRLAKSGVVRLEAWRLKMCAFLYALKAGIRG